MVPTTTRISELRIVVYVSGVVKALTRPSSAR